MLVLTILLPILMFALGFLCSYVQKHGGYSEKWQTVANFAGFIAFFAGGWFLVDALRVIESFL